MKSSLRFACNTAAWLPSKSEWIYAGKCIQKEERKRIADFNYKDDAKHCLAGRILLRYALVLSTGISWKQLKLLRGDRSKPILDRFHCENISFNVSHQGDYVVVVTDLANIGVDVMDKRESHGDVQEFFKVMTRQFTIEEWKYIKSSNDSKAQMEAFYRHWCLKESYVKALGAGISYPLLSLSFKISSPLMYSHSVCDTVLFSGGKLKHDWAFEECLVDPNHIVSVAKQRPEKTIVEFESVMMDDIIPHAQQLDDDKEIDQLFSNCFNKPIKPKRKQL